jgi:hypothetical protein
MEHNSFRSQPEQARVSPLLLTSTDRRVKVESIDQKEIFQSERLQQNLKEI